MPIHKSSVIVLLYVVVLASAGVFELRADIITDPDELTAYSHGDRIDDAVAGMTLSASTRNWQSLGTWSRYCTGHVVKFKHEDGKHTLGWELGVRFPEGGTAYSPMGNFGSQYAPQNFSADCVILRVDLAQPTNKVWVDLWNPGGSSNNDIRLRAYDDQGLLGSQLGDIGPTMTRVAYTHTTADIECFTVDVEGGFWSYPIDAVGAHLVPEPSTLVLLGIGAFALAFAWRRRRRPA